MNIQVKSILNINSMALLNSAISYTNTFNTLNEVNLFLRKKIHSLNLNKEYECGMGGNRMSGNHIWLSNVSDRTRIFIIKE